MAAFYPTCSTAQLDGLSSTTYIPDQKFASYSDAPIMNHGNMMMYLTPTSTAEELQLASRAQHSLIDGEQNLHGLSLSLSTQMSTVVPLQHPLSNMMPAKIDEASQGKDMRNPGYGTYPDSNPVAFGAPNNLHYSTNPKTTVLGGYDGAYQNDQAEFANIVFKSNYLKPAQQLLDEVVSVRDALIQHDPAKDQIMLPKAEKGSTDSKEKTVPAASDANVPATASPEISASERQELQNKLDKLLAMLDEVDRRYKQYYHQMQILVSSFEMVAGCGAAKPYTTLALQTISRHFRSLRDAINGQIQAIRKSLGEQDSGQGGVIPRLRYVDQQLRQQRALQQFGMMRHAWRPQRGLPENAVTVLRAWLFEHFLHPYPKDSEKIMLARQTGLTRGQVANWFINARVRLWKPMVEDMYKEEFGNAELNSKSSPENASKAGAEKSWTSDDRRGELQENLAESLHPGPIHTTEMSRPKRRASAMIGPHGGDDDEQRGLMRSQDDHHHHHQPYMDSHGFYPHDHHGLMAYQVPELGGYEVENNNNNNNNHHQVSLALGLRRIEGDAGQVSTVTAFRPSASTENATAEYSYLEPVNQQHRFDNSHLLNDFVA